MSFETLVEAIHAALDPPKTEFEIIVTSDCSTDN